MEVCIGSQQQEKEQFIIYTSVCIHVLSCMGFRCLSQVAKIQKWTPSRAIVREMESLEVHTHTHLSLALSLSLLHLMPLSCMINLSSQTTERGCRTEQRQRCTSGSGGKSASLMNVSNRRVLLHQEFLLQWQMIHLH